MELLNILKNAQALEPRTKKATTSETDVSIRHYERTNKFSIFFRNGCWKCFEGEGVVPLIIANRIYFAKSSEVHKQGFKMSPVNKQNISQSSRVITVSSSAHPELAKFIGEYKALQFDRESNLYFIEKPKIY